MAPDVLSSCQELILCPFASFLIFSLLLTIFSKNNCHFTLLLGYTSLTIFLFYFSLLWVTSNRFINCNVCIYDGMYNAFNRLFYGYQWNRIPYTFLFSSFFSSFLFGLVHFGIFLPQNLQVNDSHRKIHAHHVRSSESAA